MRNADTAMYHAKEHGPQRVPVLLARHEPARGGAPTCSRPPCARRWSARSSCSHYQPQLDMRSDRIVGVEALIRWQHPDWGVLSPGKFIPWPRRAD